MRTLLIAIAVDLALWWLFRPRWKVCHADRHAVYSSDSTYRAVRTFRTTGGVATTVYEAVWRNGGPAQRWHTWTCDCGGVEGYDTLRFAVQAAAAHHETHGRGAV